MSLTSRARHLARASGLGHQQAVNAIRSSGTGPQELVAQTNWPLHRADVFLHDEMADAEMRAVSQKSRYVTNAECANCYQRFFVGRDKKGEPTTASDFCPECIEEYGLDHCPCCGNEHLGVVDGICGDCSRSLR